MRAGMAVANVMVEEGGMRAAAGASGDRPAGGTAHATGGGAYTARPRRATDGGRPTYKEWGKDTVGGRWRKSKVEAQTMGPPPPNDDGGGGRGRGRRARPNGASSSWSWSRRPGAAGPPDGPTAAATVPFGGRTVRGCHWIRRPGFLAQRALIGLWSLDDSGRNESGPSHNESAGTIPCPRPDPPPAAAARAPRRFAAVAVRQSAVCGAAGRRDEGARW